MYPRLAHIGPTIISTYSVIAALGLVAAMLLAEWCATRAGMARERIWNFGLVVLCGTVLLSRFALIAQMYPSFRAYPRLVLLMPTLTKLGPLFIVISASVAIAAMRLPWLRTLDAATPAALLLLAMLHLGSFFAGDDLGSRTTLAIGNLVPGDEGHHPVALYATALTAACTGIALIALLRKHRPGNVFGVGLAGIAVARFIADEFRPGYLLPAPDASGFLRTDQLLFLALAVTGLLFLLQLPGQRDAQ